MTKQDSSGEAAIGGMAPMARLDSSLGSTQLGQGFPSVLGVGYGLVRRRFGVIPKEIERLNARKVVTRNQLSVIVAVLATIGFSLVARPITTLVVLGGICQLLYLTTLVFKARMVQRSTKLNAVVARPTMLTDEQLPTYSVLVPLYREGRVVRSLVQHLAAMDYPHEKLRILLLCEQDDEETMSVLEHEPLPDFVEILICPPGLPRTKPRALNVALASGLSNLTVIYDAEDRPDLDQLRIAASTFAVASKDLVCLQARLDYHNSRHNWLTQFFTLEYNSWFDLFLPALSGRSLPIPLGGTSNHFRTSILEELGGWDAWNVTEDADLGIRLHAAGYRADMIESASTLEEACSRVRPWLNQRSRWMKGYLQTFLVHTRSLKWMTGHPHPFRALGAFSLTILGTPLVGLLNPIFWGLLIFHAITKSEFIVRLFPGVILYTGVFSLVVGNLLVIYMNLMAVDRKRRWYLGRAAILSPIYWLLMSVATYKALWQLITKPHYWEKTPHGLSEPDAIPQPVGT